MMDSLITWLPLNWLLAADCSDACRKRAERCGLSGAWRFRALGMPVSGANYPLSCPAVRRPSAASPQNPSG